MSVLGPALDRARRAALYLYRHQRRRGQRGLHGRQPPTCRPTRQARRRHRALAPGPARARSSGRSCCARRRSPRCATLGEILSLPGVRLPSLLDPKPFERNLDSWIDWDATCTATSTPDEVDVVGTVATAARTGRTVVFVEGHHERVTHRSHAIDYVADAARRPPRARLGRDPDPVPAGAGRRSRARRAAGTSTAARG